MSNVVEGFKNSSIALLKNKKETFTDTIEKDELLRDVYQNKISNKLDIFSKIDSEKEKVIRKIEYYKKNDKEKLILWDSKNLTEEKIKKIIDDKGYDKKKAKEFLASNVSDMYHVELQSILKQSTNDFKSVLDEFTSNIEEDLNKLSKTEMGQIVIPFDFRGALAGGLAGAGVMGGLGILAAGMGNLGGYILVAKGVSLLSAVGISVGGTAAASSFVAAIGGPVTLALGIGIGVFLLGRSIFGDSWKKRIAKTLVKIFTDKQVVHQYGEQINKFWSDTITGIEILAKNLKQEYEDHIAEIEKNLATNPEEIKKLIKYSDNLLEYLIVTPQYRELELAVR
jgi:hypothetical protein